MSKQHSLHLLDKVVFTLIVRLNSFFVEPKLLQLFVKGLSDLGFSLLPFLFHLLLDHLLHVFHFQLIFGFHILQFVLQRVLCHFQDCHFLSKVLQLLHIDIISLGRDRCPLFKDSVLRQLLQDVLLVIRSFKYSSFYHLVDERLKLPSDFIDEPRFLNFIITKFDAFLMRRFALLQSWLSDADIVLPLLKCVQLLLELREFHLGYQLFCIYLLFGLGHIERTQNLNISNSVHTQKSQVECFVKQRTKALIQLLNCYLDHVLVHYFIIVYLSSDLFEQVKELPLCIIFMPPNELVNICQILLINDSIF